MSETKTVKCVAEPTDTLTVLVDGVYEEVVFTMNHHKETGSIVCSKKDALELALNIIKGLY